MTCRALVTCLVAGCALLPAAASAIPADRPLTTSVPIVLLRRSEKPAPDGSGADVLVRADPSRDEIARRAAAVLADPAGFGQQALRLDRFVRSYLLRDPRLPADRRRVLSQPAFLFLSDREGGYPAESFWLEEPSGRLVEMRDVTFVDMVVDGRDLTAGRIDGLQEIYAHELGHLMMAALAGPAPKRASTAMHFVTTRTDAWTAFVEGFGEHFQPVSLDWQHEAGVHVSRADDVPESERTWYGRFQREQVEGCVICPANLRFLHWHGAREQRLRDAPLRANRFAFQPALPSRLVDGSRPTFDCRLYRDLAMPAPGSGLKNGVQLMESEGVMATLFYRLVNDRRLRDAYRDAAFYEPFLDEGQVAALGQSGPRAVVSPVENVYLKVFDVLHRSFEWDDWPAISLVAGYARQFPDEAPAVYDVFLDVTRGVTVERGAAARHAEPGYLEGLRQRLVSGAATLDGGLGRALWLSAPTMTFGMGVYRYFLAPSPFTFDLNAAEVPDLLMVPGVSPSLAAAIIDLRERRGPFSRLDDLSAVPGMTPALLSRFRSMAEKMNARLARTEVRRTEPALVKSLLVRILKGSYYAAAAWQFGTALVLAGLAFGLARWATRATLGAGEASDAGGRAGWRRWLRRGLRGLARGMLAAAVPCAASVALYAAGILPTALNMGLVGVAMGACHVVVRVLVLRPSAPGMAAIAPTPAATVIASAVIGLMY